MEYPLHHIRDNFPSLKRQYHNQAVVYFDGPSGSQVAQPCIDAMVNYMQQGSANLGAPYLTSMESDQIVQDAREAMADFLGGAPDEIAFGMNMTSLTFAISRALARNWTPEMNIVVTELDHRANVDTWIAAAEDQGVEVRWIPLETETLTLDLSGLDGLIDEDTAVVAVGQASNGVGTINNLDAVVAVAKKHHAIVIVDAVHSAPHLSIDREELDVDIIVCSAYKFFGPHVGIASIRKEVFEPMNTYRLTTAPQVYPGKLETGTQSIEGFAGIIATIDFLASLGSGGTRKEQLHSAFELIHQHEQTLAQRLRDFLGAQPKITLYQAEVSKTPTIAFRIDGITPQDVVKHLDTHAIFAGAGHFYAKTIAQKLKLDDGWVRIGMAPYNTEDEVARFEKAIEELLNT